MQALEQPEDLFLKLRLHPDPVVGHRKNVPAVLLRGIDMYAGRLRPAILDGIAQQVLKDLCEMTFMDRYRG